MCTFITPAPSNTWAAAGSVGVLLTDLLQGPSRPHSGLVAFCIPWHMIQESVLKGGMCCSRTSRCLLVLRMLPWGFPVSSAGKESIYNAGDTSSIPGAGRSPGGGHGNPLQYSFLKNPHKLRSLAGYSSWGHKELDMTEWLSTHTSNYPLKILSSITVMLGLRLWRENLCFHSLLTTFFSIFMATKYVAFFPHTKQSSDTN